MKSSENNYKINNSLKDELKKYEAENTYINKQCYCCKFSTLLVKRINRKIRKTNNAKLYDLMLHIFHFYFGDYRMQPNEIQEKLKIYIGKMMKNAKFQERQKICLYFTVAGSKQLHIPICADVKSFEECCMICPLLNERMKYELKKERQELNATLKSCKSLLKDLLSQKKSLLDRKECERLEHAYKTRIEELEAEKKIPRKVREQEWLNQYKTWRFEKAYS